MTRQIAYEWDIETVDEFGDIHDHNHSARCPGIPAEPNERLVLVRDAGNDDDGITDRQWAYVVDGKLPAKFSDALDVERASVPARFHRELSNA